MKKTIAMLMALCTLLSFFGCAASTSSAFEGQSLEDVLNAVYANMEQEEEIPSLATMQIDKENEEYYLGKQGIAYEEAIASEPMISAIAYSVCLVRMKKGEDIEAAKKLIKENVDPRKWICVGVEPQNVIVDSAGDVIILIMSDTNAKDIQSSFLALAEKK